MLHKNFFHDSCRLGRLILWRKIQKCLKIIRILDDLKKTKDDLETKISRNVTVTVLSSFRLRSVPKITSHFRPHFTVLLPWPSINTVNGRSSEERQRTVRNGRLFWDGTVTVTFQERKIPCDIRQYKLIRMILT
jgi:hypothetical protein